MYKNYDDFGKDDKEKLSLVASYLPKDHDIHTLLASGKLPKIEYSDTLWELNTPSFEETTKERIIVSQEMISGNS